MVISWYEIEMFCALTTKYLILMLSVVATGIGELFEALLNASRLSVSSGQQSTVNASII